MKYTFGICGGFFVCATFSYIYIQNITNLFKK